MDVLFFGLLVLNLLQLGQTQGTCEDFQVMFGQAAIISTGFDLQTPTSFNQCLKVCGQLERCQAIDWRLRERICQLYFNDVKTQKNGLVTHARKTCQTPVSPGGRGPNDGGGKRPVTGPVKTTTRMPGTTGNTLPPQPTRRPNNRLPTIGDSGKCPDPFQKYEMTSVENGNLLTNVSDESNCKMFCQNYEMCVAVKFDMISKQCVWFQTLDLGRLQRGQDPCCDLFARTNCETPRCYTHAAVDLSQGDNMNAQCIRLGENQTLDDLQADECNGACYVTQDIEVTADGTSLLKYTIERGCDPLPFDQEENLCEITEASPGGNINYRIQCRCGTDCCNGLDVDAMKVISLYFPFDHGLDDLSGYGRDAAGAAVEYNGIDSMKSASAYFNGANSLVIPSLSLYQFGGINPQTSEIYPSFTLAFWLKRTGSIGNMVILSNGIKDGPLQVTSEATNGQQRLEVGVRLINGEFYTVSGEAPLNEWVFMAVVLQQNITNSTQSSLSLFLTPEDADIISATNMITTPAYLVQQTIEPLYLGRRALQFGFKSQADYFEGLLDELYLFSEALSLKQLHSLRDLSGNFTVTM